MSDVHVFAVIHPKPGCRDRVAAILGGILPDTRAEPGCRRFELNAGSEDDRLYLVEAWVSEEALSAHHARPYTRAAADRIDREGLIAAPTDVIRMIPL